MYEVGSVLGGPLESLIPEKFSVSSISVDAHAVSHELRFATPGWAASRSQPKRSIPALPKPVIQKSLPRPRY